jgi:hypothetical protein
LTEAPVVLDEQVVGVVADDEDSDGVHVASCSKGVF